MTVQLAEFVTDFARGMESVDSRLPRAINQRSKVAFQPGIGPHTEIATVELVMDELAFTSAESYGHFRIGLPYEEGSRQKCDLALGKHPSWEWLIEVKMIRMLGDNAKPNDNLPTHILSPYRAHRSALTDCAKLESSGIAGRKAIVMYGYEPDEWPLDPLVSAFECLATHRVNLGRRLKASFDGLVHPVHRRGAVYAWEILSIGDRRDQTALSAAFGRVAHSFESVLYAEAWLRSQAQTPAAARDQGWDAHIESFLIHARKLMDLLDPRGRPHPDEVRLTDFLVGAERIPVDIAEAVRSQISKQLTHITHPPVLDESGQTEWPIWAIRDSIVDAVERFGNALRPTYPQGVRRLERAVKLAEVGDPKRLRD